MKIEEINNKVSLVFRGFISVSNRPSTCEGCENYTVLDINVNSAQEEMFEDYEVFIDWVLDEGIDNIIVCTHRE